MGAGESGSPARVRRAKRAEVRRRLVEAAAKVFAERGFEGTSLERVAELAGFSKGAVYSNFANKDELFFELVASRIGERTEAIREGILREPVGDKVPARLARMVGERLRGIGEADPAWQVLFIEFWLRCMRSEDLRKRLSEKRFPMRARIAELVEVQAAAYGVRLRPGAGMDLATIMLALSNGLGIEGLIDSSSVRPGLLGDILASVIAAATADPGEPRRAAGKGARREKR